MIVAAWAGLLTAPVHLAPADSSATDSGGSQKPVFEEWVVVVLDGSPCGHGSTITTAVDTPSGPGFRTVHEEEFVAKRDNEQFEINESSTITEDSDGGVLDFVETTSGKGSNVEMKGTREGDDLVVTSRGQTARFHVPRLDALGPEKVRRLCNAVPLKPGQTYSFNTFSSEYPQASVVEDGTVVKEEIRAVRGNVRKLWKIVSETSMTPGMLSTSWVDDQSNDVENLTVIPGIGDLHEYVTDRAEALRPPKGAEIFTNDLIRPQQALPSPHDLGQAVYRLSTVDLDKKIDVWNQGEQQILSTEPGSCEVQVTSQPISPDDVDWQLPHEDTPELHPYLQSSTYLEVNSIRIQALARLAVGQEQNPVRAAHKIEDFVRAFITKKDLKVAFASADETAKSREGDCTEHAVLCAALGRAAGLPTRCVVGFGYLPPGEDNPAVGSGAGSDTGAFGFHMWAEAWVWPDEWVPMDAALDGFDVGHIAVVKTALSEINPLVDLNAPILQMMENMHIEVLKTVDRKDMPPVPHRIAHVKPSPAPEASAHFSPAPAAAPVPPVYVAPAAAPTSPPD
ncbi:MAG: transglutaminase-like domain-containing protein [Methylacidiphilales bacterium]|nr:transglutaminase-like domain-containing protein [Candidatus Methylacidiphilales bacterium]